jgi:hypothetical protein
MGDDSIVRPALCHGQTISRIDVHPFPPFESMRGPELVQRALRLANSAHHTTKESVVRRFLDLHVGDTCDELRRRESERLLRAQPFFASAVVAVIPDTNNTVALDVTTIDEISLVIDGSVSSRTPYLTGASFGEANLAGTGTYAVGGWRDGDALRDRFHGRLLDYQFLGRPYQFLVEGTRAEVGGSYLLQLSHPFVTDLQRVAWSMSNGEIKRYFQFLQPDAPSVSLPTTRTFSDIGVVRAFGSPGHLLLLGLSLSRERESTGSMPLRFLPDGLAPDTSTVLMDRFGEHASSRANLLFGVRRVEFLPVHGFDAVEGVQDVRRGFQVSYLLGRGFRFLGEDVNDYFMSGDMYYGTGNAQSFFAVETLSERRRDMDRNIWDGILASGRAAWYIQPRRGHTTISSLEFSGGWRTRVPFQLTFADGEGGLRGYRASRLGGGRRLVWRLEDRYSLGHWRQLAALAGAGFIDAGALWAGDAPFGVNTGLKASAGVSLLIAFPPNSRRTWRVDLAFPINDRGDARSVELRFTARDLTRVFWKEPSDVEVARERAIPNSVYNWP